MVIRQGINQALLLKVRLRVNSMIKIVKTTKGIKNGKGEESNTSQSVIGIPTIKDSAASQLRNDEYARLGLRNIEHDHSDDPDLSDGPITEDLLDQWVVSPNLSDGEYLDVIKNGRIFFESEFGSAMGKVVGDSLEAMKTMGLFLQAKYVTAMVKDAMLTAIGERAKYVEKEKGKWLLHQPVSVKTFIEDRYFMNSKGVIYPKVMDCLIEINSGNYQEVVLTGAIGTAKSTIALYSIACQLYLLSCYASPHALFDLDPSSEIIFIFQSINAQLAKSVDYNRFRSMLEKSPYFKEQFPFNKDIASEMRFPNRIIVKPVSGSETGAIGQNVIGGMIDEMNFMALVEGSKASADGSTYDQAIALYNSIARRRKSRFMVQGKLPGLLCLVSSKRYPGQFTDRKAEEAQRERETFGKSSIYVYDKRTWDIKPRGSFSGKWFNLFIGDESRKPRIMEDGETVPLTDVHLVMKIPEEYRMEFEMDMMNALRDVAGVSTLATYPFIVNRNKVMDAMRKLNNPFSREWVDFATTFVEFDIKQVIHPSIPRFVHVDLAVTGDSAGFVVGHVCGFKMIQKDVKAEDGDYMPQIWIDGVLEVKPPKGGEIIFHRIRELIYMMASMGLGIRWVTFDQYQSTDSIQLLRQSGYVVGRQSMDATMTPYDFLKNALYEDRINIPYHPKLVKELISLEKDVKRGKIDHPVHGCHRENTPVDCSDGVVRSMGSLTNDWEAGITHDVKSWDASRQEVCDRLAYRPHVTKYVTELVEVEMENGEVFSCTPDHPYLMINGEYVAAEDLKAGDDLRD
jgi:hypothetical protein